MMEEKIQKRFWAIAYILLAVQLLFCVYTGMQKEGFHEDEYYSYYSTNRTAGLYVNDRTWEDTDTIRDEFVVLPGEGFNYGLVAQVQSWDVHPPLYYDILHTFCSILPELFSKWVGIFVNMIAFGLAFLVLLKLMELLQVRKSLQLIILAIWGFHPMTLSFVMFTRMYMWLTVFVLGCAYLHIRLLQASRAMDSGLFTGFSGMGLKQKTIFGARYVLPIMVCSYLGFLTQYYYMIFFFFMGVSFTVWILFRRSGKEKKILQKIMSTCMYVLCCAISLALAVLSYPASAAQIFHGYRGSEAISSFTDSANILQRLLFFGKLLNSDVFAGTFLVLALVILLLYILLRISISVEHCVLLFSTAGYFLTVAKTALLLGDTSNRYEMPVYGPILLLTITAVDQALSELMTVLEGRHFLPLRIREHLDLAGQVLRGVLAAVFCVWILWADLWGGKIMFLYKEDAAKTAYAAEMAKTNTPAIVLYNSATPDKVWWLTDELLKYPQLYFMSEDNEEPVTDETITTAQSLIVYAADSDNQEEMLEMILAGNPGLQSYTVVSKEDNWTAYRFD